MIFFADSRILLGIGIGLILGVVFMFGYKYEASITNSQIEERARELGMIYKSESKAMLKGED
jgi:predicted negative regulator of RcsB-dependent stress response